jgi:hypothetical protein
MDHHFRCGASGKVEGYEDKYYYGKRANGVYVVRYQNLNANDKPYLRGFGYQGSASREGWGREVAELNIGGEFKDALSEPGQWTMGITAFGEMLPYHENRITLDKNLYDKDGKATTDKSGKTKTDKWNLPVLAIDCEIKDNEKKMRVDMMNDAKEMLEIAGLKKGKHF